MISTERRLPSSCKFLHKALLVFFFLQLLFAGLSAKLVVKEKDIANLQLAQLEAEAELVEDKTLPLECRREVENMIWILPSRGVAYVHLNHKECTACIYSNYCIFSCPADSSIGDLVTD